MRFLKTIHLNRRQFPDERLQLDSSDQVSMVTTNNLLIPKGTTAQQPGSPVTGMIRYNSTTNQFEGYQSGAWRSFRFKEAAGVSLQNAGTGNATYTIFGPLSPDPFTLTYQSGVTWDATQIAKNLVVIAGQVPQVGTVNFTIVQNPSATGIGAEIAATSLSSGNNGTQYVITFVGTTTFTSFGAAANTVGTVFTKSGGTPTGTGQVRLVGTYLSFTTPVPNAQVVYVYQGYDQ